MHKASGASFPSCIMWWGNPILIKDESRNVAAGGGSTCCNSWSRKWESSSITPNRPPVSRHSLRQTWTSAARAITEHRTPWAFKFWKNKKSQSLHTCSQMQRIRAITFVTWPTATAWNRYNDTRKWIQSTETIRFWPNYEVSTLHSIFELHKLLLTFFTDSSYVLLIDMQFSCSQRSRWYRGHPQHRQPTSDAQSSNIFILTQHA